jgi:hypothetical protein
VEASKLGLPLGRTDVTNLELITLVAVAVVVVVVLAAYVWTVFNEDLY